MRINQFIARATGLSRRAADLAVSQDRVLINGRPAAAGDTVSPEDKVTLDGKQLQLPNTYTIVLLNKPVGYVCSRDGQGNLTIYELLPKKLHNLKPVGRLDKDSSGLLLMTDDGALANQLTHPRYAKEKVYDIELDRPLEPADHTQITDGIQLDDGPSHLKINSAEDRRLTVTMSEGRNRQIRRTFAALGYTVTRLHRRRFGSYELPTHLQPAHWVRVNTPGQQSSINH